MKAITTGDDEIYIRLVPSRSDSSPEFARRNRRPGEGPTRAYDALIYTNLNLPGFSHLDPGPVPQSDEATTIPLAAVEQVVVKWSRYEEYLADFVEGLKEPGKMADRLFETLSPGLQVLFSDQKLADRPVRVWWDCETPEVEDFPWELMAYRHRGPSLDFSFVRGQPPSQPVPKVPLRGPLRMAFIHNPDVTPWWLQEVLTKLSPTVRVIQLTIPPHEALKTAAREGYELVHIVADGIVSLSYEGVLYFYGSPSVEVSASELSSLLNGSRVSVLSLTEPETQNPDKVLIGPYEVPSAYRAFAYLNRAIFPLPNIVAPLGPSLYWQKEQFWQRFYTSLNETHEIEKAMAGGRAGDHPAMALFLRQSQRRTFEPLASAQEAPVVEPTQISADLQQSIKMVNQLKTLQARFGDMPEGVKKFFTRETARQVKLEAELGPWLKGEGERS
jgi:hypothetical protein